MKALRSHVRFLFLTLAVLWPAAVLADGMVIPTRAYAIPSIPDQQALIHYADGTETLVIETSFVGQGTNFAWVVPLPAPAKIEPVSSGLFPTLQITFQPQVVLSVTHYWIALPLAALLIWLVRLKESFAVFTVIGILLLLVSFLLPALAPARSRSKSAGATVTGVRVLNHQPAGLFDTVTLQSTNATALLTWLNENGFSTPTNIAPVVAGYVRDGWVFAAARLHSDAGEQAARATHPLAFTFKTTQPVYPLRLTGTGTISCRVDLYVFGPDRAAVPGFSVQRCEKPSYNTEVLWPRLQAGPLQIRHQELAKLVAGAPVATKLSATLSPSDMARDVYVGWRSYWPCGSRAYSRPAALTLSGNIAALLFMVLVAIWWLYSQWTFTAPNLHPIRQPNPVGQKLKIERWGPWLAPVAIVVGAACFFGLPKLGSENIRKSRSFGPMIRNNVLELAIAFGEGMEDWNVISHPLIPPRPLTRDELDRLLEVTSRNHQRASSGAPIEWQPFTNCFTGEPIRFEASPGNVSLQHTLLKYNVVWHDLDGAEAITNSISP